MFKRLGDERAIVHHLIASPLAEESRERIGNEKAFSHANGSVHRTGSSESGRHRSSESRGALAAPLTEALAKSTSEQPIHSVVVICYIGQAVGGGAVTDRDRG
jgi:hypothetical protein